MRNNRVESTAQVVGANRNDFHVYSELIKVLIAQRPFRVKTRT